MCDRETGGQGLGERIEQPFGTSRLYPTSRGLAKVRLEKAVAAWDVDGVASAVAKTKRVNLLAGVMSDPQKFAVRGKWTVNGKDLTCARQINRLF